MQSAPETLSPGARHGTAPSLQDLVKVSNRPQATFQRLKISGKTGSENPWYRESRFQRSFISSPFHRQNAWASFFYCCFTMNGRFRQPQFPGSPSVPGEKVPAAQKKAAAFLVPSLVLGRRVRMGGRPSRSVNPSSGKFQDRHQTSGFSQQAAPKPANAARVAPSEKWSTFAFCKARTSLASCRN